MKNIDKLIINSPYEKPTRGILGTPYLIPNGLQEETRGVESSFGEA